MSQDTLNDVILLLCATRPSFPKTNDSGSRLQYSFSVPASAQALGSKFLRVHITMRIPSTCSKLPGRQESAAAGCKHGQGWVPPAFTKILLVLPCELGKPVLACVACKYRLLQKLSRYAEHITAFAFHLKIPAWNFPQLTDWVPCCYGPPKTRLAPSLLYLLASLPLFWDNLCMSFFFC